MAMFVCLSLIPLIIIIEDLIYRKSFILSSYKENYIRKFKKTEARSGGITLSGLSQKGDLQKWNHNI